MLALDAKPNAAHRKLAELETAGKLKAVITQNIDGLHQLAGSKKVPGATRKRASELLHEMRALFMMPLT